MSETESEFYRRKISLDEVTIFPKMDIIKVLFVMLFFHIICNANVADSNRPHIIFIYADDLGWNDVSFHGSVDIPTPNIDALGLNGLILNDYYGEWLCTPSRAALLTGMYPMRLGLQHYVINGGEDTNLPLDVATLPEHLKKLGYVTHMVGKWHLGYSKKEHTPTYKGFDTFFGYYNGFIGYYDYTYDDALYGDEGLPVGVDLHNGTEDILTFRGKYATYAFTDFAKDLIMNHDTSKPLFLYLPQAAVHIGNKEAPLQAPPEVISRFKYIKEMNRRIQAATISAMDDAVGTIFEALSHRNMLQNSIVCFVSDNGGVNRQEIFGYSSNYPLRGSKSTPWEGGVRLPAVVWSPLLKETAVSRQLMHVTDWLPTLYTAAGGDITDLGPIDGINMWDTLSQPRTPSPRDHVLHTLDPIIGVSAFRRGDFKVVNNTSTGLFAVNTWLGPTGTEYTGRPPSMYEWVFKNGCVVKDVLEQEGWWISQNPDSVYEDALVSCEKPVPNSATKCKPEEAPCLFNVKEDPCEYHNLAKENPDIVKSLMDEIYAYEKVQVTPQSKPSDPRADPVCHNFTYVTWLDPEHYTECDYAS